MIRTTLLKFCLVVVSFALTASAAVARDRPGTPNQLRMWDCSIAGPNGARTPQLCVTFANTANEDNTGVTFDVSLYENNATKLDNAGHVVCFAESGVADSVCSGGPTMNRNIPEGFKLQRLRPNTQYCLEIWSRRYNDHVQSLLPTRGCATTAGEVSRAAAPPPPAPTPTPRPVKITGRPKSQVSGFAGLWSTVTSQGGYFELYLAASGASVTGMFTSSDSAKYNGMINGDISPDGRVLQFTFTQPQVNMSGSGILTLAADGATIEGGGAMTESKAKFSWKGTKKFPPPKPMAQ